MKLFVLCSLCLFSSLFLPRVESGTLTGEEDLASTPPRGWNSYDSYGWSISEREFLENAALVAKRLKYRGYEYVVVDFLWYRRKVEGASTNSLGLDVIDEWGRMVPDPDRWPSSRGGKGFAEVAKKVHGMGLKFGIHVMAGLSMQAFNQNTPVLDPDMGGAYEESGKQWRAQDIGIKERPCQWMPNGFMSVNTKLGAGKAFLRSLYQQFADWGVDLVKQDCVFGVDFNGDEISYVSEVLRQLNRPIVYSLSPGVGATPTLARSVSNLVNMYRIAGDDWDNWEDIVAHFDVARDFAAAAMVGAKSLKGRSWPDLDMLPLGWLTDPNSNDGPHRYCNLTLDEQRTQLTLWSMAKSPLMFGGDMRNLDKITYRLLTNPTLMEINSFSSNNNEFSKVTCSSCESTYFKLSKPVLDLTSCQETRARGWLRKFVDSSVQICWEESSNNQSFCLLQNELKEYESLANNRQYHENKIRLLPSNGVKDCLGGTSSRKLPSREFNTGDLSPCKQEANQMWELNHDGTLRNSYSGLCAFRNELKVASGGIRSWIATGRKGEIYVAFFNMNAHRTVISAKIDDLAEALPDQHLVNTSCWCREVWSNRNFGHISDSITTAVEAHGCALFELNCDKGAL